MGNVIYSSSILTPSAYVKSSENASFPASNVHKATYPFRPWKADSAIQNEWVGLDLGSAKNVKALVVDYANVASVSVQADSTATFNSTGGNPAYGYSGGDIVTAISLDKEDNRYKLFFALDETYRYFRIKVLSASTTDASASARIGSLVALSTYTTLTQNFGYPFEREIVDPTLGEGTNEPIQIAQKYLRLTLSSTTYPSTTMASEMATLASHGKHVPLVIYENNSDTSKVYITHRTGAMNLRKVGPNSTQFTALTFREVGPLMAG